VRSRGASRQQHQQRQHQHQPIVPPTPVTILDETPMSPDSHSPALPNIFVLGQAHQQTWSTTASDISGYTRSSQRTRSTAPTNSRNRTGSAAANAMHAPREDPDVANVKLLVLRAAMDRGFSRDASGAATVPALQAFVGKLPASAFGPQQAHAALLASYRSLVTADGSYSGMFSSSSSSASSAASSAASGSGSGSPGQQQGQAARLLPPPGRQATGVDVSRSILWLTHHNPRLGFLRDLFMVVFGFPMEDAHAHDEQTVIQV
jgi:hypothetical protein